MLSHSGRPEMRVLALVTDAFGGFGGIAAYNRNFLSALADGGARITVLPRMDVAHTLPAGIDQAVPRHSRIVYSVGALITVLRDRPFDMIWSGHLRMQPLAHLAGRIADCPVWLQVHGVDAWGGPPPLVKSTVEACRMITAVSRYTRHRLLGWADIAPERVRVLQNCIDGPFNPGPHPAALRMRYGICGGPVLLTVARISKDDGYKGHDRVLRLLPCLLRHFPELVYVVGGDGDDRPRLEALANELGVAAQCRFIGRIPDGEMADHYRLADLFVMPSTGEGFGIVYLEAMACGVPAVGLDVDGSVDPLTACRLGHAVPEERLAHTIIAILSDPPPRPAIVPEDLAPFSREAFGWRVRALAEEVVA